MTALTGNGACACLARTDFFLESSLQLLTLSLERDPASGAALLQCTAQFADRLPPLSLFSSSSGVIDRSLRALIDWLTSQAAAPGTDRAALTILIKLVLARGTLTALLHRADFLCAKPELLAQGSVLSELQKLCNVESFEESARANFFGPAPGSGGSTNLFGRYTGNRRSSSDPFGTCSHVGGSFVANTKVHVGFTFWGFDTPQPRRVRESVLFLFLNTPLDQGVALTSFPKATRAPLRNNSPAECSFSPRLSGWNTEDRTAV